MLRVCEERAPSPANPGGEEQRYGRQMAPWLRLVQVQRRPGVDSLYLRRDRTGRARGGARGQSVRTEKEAGPTDREPIAFGCIVLFPTGFSLPKPVYRKERECMPQRS